MQTDKTDRREEWGAVFVLVFSSDRCFIRFDLWLNYFFVKISLVSYEPFGPSMYRSMVSWPSPVKVHFLAIWVVTVPLSVTVVVTSLTTTPLPFGSQLAVRLPFADGVFGAVAGVNSCSFPSMM